MSITDLIPTTLKKILHIPEPVPAYLQIAMTNVCNKDCGMCIRSQVPLEIRHIDFEDFKKIVDKSDGVKGVTLVGMGEPLVYPRLMEAIRYCKDRGLIVRITTNGILLKEKVEELIDAGLDRIHISMEDTGQQELIDTLHKLQRLRREKGVSNPKIIVQPILFDDKPPGRTLEDLYRVIEWCGENNIEQVNIARVDLRTDPTMKRPDLAKEREVFKRFAKLRVSYPKMRIDCLQDQIFTGLKGLGYRYFKRVLRLDSYCYRFQDYMYVDVNGNAHPCPINMEQVMGNVLSDDLKSVWHGKKFKELRKDQNIYSFCRRCDFLKLKQVDPTIQ